VWVKKEKRKKEGQEISMIVTEFSRLKMAGAYRIAVQGGGGKEHPPVPRGEEKSDNLLRFGRLTVFGKTVGKWGGPFTSQNLTRPHGGCRKKKKEGKVLKLGKREMTKGYDSNKF